MSDDRPHSLPAGCSKFSISDSGESIQNLDTVPLRSRVSQVFMSLRKPPSQSRRRSGSEPQISHISEAQSGDAFPRSFAESTMVMAYDSSVGSVTVDISDLQVNGSAHVTMAMLRKCNRQIIRPFRFILVLVAWRPFRLNSYTRHPMLWNFINFLFSFIIISLLLVSYVYQIFMCRWGPAPRHHDIEPTNNSVDSNGTSLLPDGSTNQPEIRNLYCSFEPKIKGSYLHLVSIYLIPNFLHFISYLIGFWHFRINSSEHVYALMEKVFLSFPRGENHGNNQKRLVLILRIYMFTCVIWTTISVASNFLYDNAFVYKYAEKFTPCSTLSCTYFMLISEVLGNIVCYVVSVVITFNYAVQCEAITAYIGCLLQKIQERSIDLREVIKEINWIKQNLKILNGATSVMMCILMFILGELSVMGIIILVRGRWSSDIDLAYRIIFVIRTLPLAVFPIIQATRLNRCCNRIQHSGIEVRTNGYRNASQLELDSFLLYTSKNRFWAKLYGFPIRGYHITILIIASLIALVVLVQMDIIRLEYL